MSRTLLDMILPCRACGQAFLYTAAERAFYLERGLVYQPPDCPACRSHDPWADASSPSRARP